MLYLLTRSGVSNDLFDNAKEIKRILASTKNVYDVYDKILNEAVRIDKNELVLIVLGSAGKCLAYDMFNLGYQVVDIGQVDMYYAWYLKGQEIKTPNPYKYVLHLPEMEIKDIDNIEYNKQIIAKIM